jgi:hypothetical protein
MSVDNRLIGQHRNPNSLKFKPPKRIDYKILAKRFEDQRKHELAKMAYEAASHVNQLSDVEVIKQPAEPAPETRGFPRE